MNSKIESLYRVNGIEPRVDDVCIVDSRTMTLVQGGAIFRRADGLRMVQQLTDYVGRPCFIALPTADCGPYMGRASRVVKEGK
jgi:hypothetical protein